MNSGLETGRELGDGGEIEFPSEFVLDAGDQVDLGDGRKIVGISLLNEDGMTSLAGVIGEAFDCSVGSRKDAIRKSLILLSEHNKIVGEEDKFNPVVIIYKGRERPTNYYLIPVDETNDLIDFLRERKDEIEEFLPFHVSEDEMLSLREENTEIIQLIYSRSLRVFAPPLVRQGVPASDAEIKINELLNNEGIWDVLINSDLPVDLASDFQRLIRTSIYRFGLNWMRDVVREEKKNEPFYYLTYVPILKKFLENNELDSQSTQKLLRILNVSERSLFILRAYENLSPLDICDALGLDDSEAKIITRVTGRVNRNLNEILEKPMEEWPRPKVRAVLEALAITHPEHFEEWLAFLGSYKQRVVGNLKFQKLLKNTEIEQRMGLSEGGVKSLVHRTSANLLKFALESEIILPGDVEIPDNYYVAFPGIDWPQKE